MDLQLNTRCCILFFTTSLSLLFACSLHAQVNARLPALIAKKNGVSITIVGSSHEPIAYGAELVDEMLCEKDHVFVELFDVLKWRREMTAESAKVGPTIKETIGEVEFEKINELFAKKYGFRLGVGAEKNHPAYLFSIFADLPFKVTKTRPTNSARGLESEIAKRIGGLNFRRYEHLRNGASDLRELAAAVEPADWLQLVRMRKALVSEDGLQMQFSNTISTVARAWSAGDFELMFTQMNNFEKNALKNRYGLMLSHLPHKNWVKKITENSSKNILVLIGFFHLGGSSSLQRHFQEDGFTVIPYFISPRKGGCPK